MSYTLELPPDVAEQLHKAVSYLHTNEHDVLLKAAQEYLERMVPTTKDSINEEWLDYGEELREIL